MLNGEIAPSQDDAYAGDWVHFEDGTAVPKALNGYFQGRSKTIDGMGTGCTMFNQNRRKELIILVSYFFCPTGGPGSLIAPSLRVCGRCRPSTLTIY